MDNKVTIRSWKDMEEFWDTSIWTYIKRKDWENVRSKLSGVVYRLKQKPKSMMWWVRHRTTDRYNIVDTGLPFGYYDADYLMLHACFNLLKEYVEIECAWMQLMVTDDREMKPWWMTLKGFRKRHGRELGLKHLASWDDAKSSPESELWDQATIDSQKEKYHAIRDLYLWWMDVYPNRERTAEYEIMLKQDQEEEEKLVALMKIRQTLWT